MKTTEAERVRYRKVAQYFVDARLSDGGSSPITNGWGKMILAILDDADELAWVRQGLKKLEASLDDEPPLHHISINIDALLNPPPTPPEVV